MAKEVKVLIHYHGEKQLPYFHILFTKMLEPDPEARKQKLGTCYTRIIMPEDEEDFRRWMDELINHWEIQPEAFNRNTLETVKKLLNGFNIGWDESFNEENERIKRDMANDRPYTLREIVEISKTQNLFLTERKIRYYEKIGLLSKPMKINGVKYYSILIICELENIIQQREKGKKLSEIKSLT